MTQKDQVVRDVVVFIQGLQELGYTVGVGSVEVRGDAIVVFHLAKDDPTFVQDLLDLGFAHPYEREFATNRHHIHSRDR